MSRRAAGCAPSTLRGTGVRMAAALLLLMLPVTATPAAAQLAKVDMEKLRLVYFGGSESYLAPHVARAFLNSLAFQEKLFTYEPFEKISVLLADFADSGNAGATVIPRNALTVQIAPLSFAFETLAANERMTTIMNHELVHIATMDGATGPDLAFRRLFRGKVSPIVAQPETILYLYLTAPRVAAPRWYHEGSAVFVDTWMAGGLGRAQSGWDEMVFRAMVRDNAHIYDPLGLASEGTKIDFQLQINSYLYGARFMTWLAGRYTPAQLIEWLSRHPGSKGNYASQFRKVYGRSLDDAWNEWIGAEKAFQTKNLEAIRRYATTPYTDVSPRGLGSVSRAYYDAAHRKVYAAFNYPGVVAHVGAIATDTGAVEKIVDIKGPSIYTVTALAWDPGTGTLFYTTDNNAHRDLVSVDPVTHKTTLLMKDARIGDLAFNQADRSLWGIRHLNGICSLVRIPAPYREWNRVISFPYGLVPYDLDVSPDGTRVSASFGEISGQQNVRLFDTEGLLAGKAVPVAEFEFGTSVPSSFTFSPDGRYLYGSAYFTGVSNIFRYDIAAKKTEALTNAETGFFRPVVINGDNLLAFRFSGQGFVPTRITVKPLEDVSEITFLGQTVIEKHPELKAWMVGSPASVPYDTLKKTIGTYHLAGGLQLESLYPILQGYKDTQAIGLRVNFSDPLQLNRLDVSGSYSPAGDIDDSERVHLRAEYQRYDWTAKAQWNNGDFYDLFGPTKVSRKGYYVGLSHKRTLIYDEPKTLSLEFDGSYSGNLDQLPWYQNVTVDITNLAVLQAKLNFSNVRSSLGKVDDEKRTKATLVANAAYVNQVFVPAFLGTVDEGFALPAKHWSIWLRAAAGFSPTSVDNPFANFYFGGFGNNWVDHGNEKRYREFYAFPGAALNEISGRNFLKSTVEWNLPPIRFSRAGKPGFYVTWARPAIFVSGLVTNMDAPTIRRTVADCGGQLDFQLGVLSTLDMTLSVGGALAFEDGYKPRREAMISLKILR